jgi:Arc/MetJ family transcription regulator
MRTTVDLPADLLTTAMELSPGRTKREVLTAALQEYVERLLREELRRKRSTDFLHLAHEDLQWMRADG